MTPILRVSVTFMAYYAATGAAWPYLPIYYHELGLDLQAIGAVSALGSAVQLLTAPAWGGLADSVAASSQRPAIRAWQYSHAPAFT